MFISRRKRVDRFIVALETMLLTSALVTRHAVLASVREIGREDWNRLYEETAEGYDFFITLEASALTEFSFYYICIYTDRGLELIAPVFSSDFDLGIGLEGNLSRGLQLIRKIRKRFLIEKTLFCGSPFGECGAIGISPDPARQPVLLGELVSAMRQLSKEKKLSFLLFKDFPTTTRKILNPLERSGFFKGESFPNVTVPLPCNSIEEYLATLSYSCRKDLRRKVRKALSAAEIEVRVVDTIDDLVDEVYGLYLQTYEAGTVRFEKLTRNYFLSVSREMRGTVKFFLYYVEGKLTCFNLCFCHGGRLIDKFIGFDYRVSRDLNLYFYTWYYNVGWCIQNGVREYQVGQTDHDVKLRLGGKLVPLNFYAKHTNPWINAVLRSVSRFLVPHS